MHGWLRCTCQRQSHLTVLKRHITCTEAPCPFCAMCTQTSSSCLDMPHRQMYILHVHEDYVQTILHVHVDLSPEARSRQSASAVGEEADMHSRPNPNMHTHAGPGPEAGVRQRTSAAGEEADIHSQQDCRAQGQRDKGELGQGRCKVKGTVVKKQTYKANNTAHNKYDEAKGTKLGGAKLSRTTKDHKVGWCKARQCHKGS
eukprot:1158485-Pelagomonas_calceolata.AAC.7